MLSGFVAAIGIADIVTAAVFGATIATTTTIPTTMEVDTLTGPMPTGPRLDSSLVGADTGIITITMVDVADIADKLSLPVYSAVIGERAVQPSGWTAFSFLHALSASRSFTLFADSVFRTKTDKCAADQTRNLDPDRSSWIEPNDSSLNALCLRAILCKR
jgi:hypothetical protein